MKHFLSINDLDDLKGAVRDALALKQAPYAYQDLGKNKALGAIFLNPSLRTRISTQRAAQMLGMSSIVHNAGQDGWNLEFDDGKVMNGDKSEHIKDAVAVLGEYFDILAVRCFPSLTDRNADYQEQVLSKFVEYSGKPVISLESATGHPLQALADMMTIANAAPKRPKVVLSWAPHVRTLPQSVPNSFAQAALAMDYELVITHPPGYELSPEFTDGAEICYDQKLAFKHADIIYAKNWSSYEPYGTVLEVHENWTIDASKMAVTNNAGFMHCLPIRRNLIADDSVLDSPQSLIYQQAGHRVFACMHILKTILEQS